jgi:hypothetical protein
MFWARLFRCDDHCCGRWLLEVGSAPGRVTSCLDEAAGMRALLASHVGAAAKGKK